MAELVGEAIFEAVVDLASEGGLPDQGRGEGGVAKGNSTAAAAPAKGRLPPPMVPGNADTGPSTCFLQVRMLGFFY